MVMEVFYSFFTLIKGLKKSEILQYVTLNCVWVLTVHEEPAKGSRNYGGEALALKSRPGAT